MGSKDRILRMKDDNRKNILMASLDIVKEEGWQSLSMRKIADKIEYTAPMIYEYFDNKEAIVLELTRKGFLILGRDMKVAKEQHLTPEAQLEAMWLAYWNFAFTYKELYQVMFGVQTNSVCAMTEKLPEAREPWDLVTPAIAELMGAEDLDDDTICTKYYTFWSVIHGLISINILSLGSSDDINRQVLMTAIIGIIRSIKG